LPLLSATAASPKPDTVSPHPLAGSETAPNRGPAARPLRVLLVEDHGDTARIMSRLLTRRGYEVHTAGDVTTALGVAGSQRFDLVISDLGLPDRSGLELIGELRAAGHTMPAIALSGYGQEEDIQRSRLAGFSMHLTKPVDFEQFYRAIATVMQ
jgi:CheY-like chemotaxis protein